MGRVRYREDRRQIRYRNNESSLRDPDIPRGHAVFEEGFPVGPGCLFCSQIINKRFPAPVRNRVRLEGKRGPVYEDGDSPSPRVSSEEVGCGRGRPLQNHQNRIQASMTIGNEQSWKGTQSWLPPDKEL